MDNKVMVYQDPLTRLKPEGKAVLVKFLQTRPGGLQEWSVRFEGDAEDTIRLLTDNDLRDAAIARAKAGILEDMVSGAVPWDVATFSDLHDHVDANEYLIPCAGVEIDVAWLETEGNAICEAVNKWLSYRRGVNLCNLDDTVQDMIDAVDNADLHWGDRGDMDWGMPEVVESLRATSAAFLAATNAAVAEPGTVTITLSMEEHAALSQFIEAMCESTEFLSDAENAALESAADKIDNAK